MLIIFFVIFGSLSIINSELSFTPNINQPGLTILVRYPGASAEKIMNLVTRKVENALSMVPGIVKQQSVTSEGKCKVHLLFPYDTNLDTVQMDILDVLAPVAHELPTDIEKPVVLRYDPTDAPVFTIGISGKDLQQCRRFAEKKLKTAFERVKGVSEVIIAGGTQKEVLIAVDSSKALGRSVNLLQIVQSVQKANIEKVGGTLKSSRRETLTKTIGRFTSLDTMKAVNIGSTEKKILLSDIAVIKRTNKKPDNLALINGQEQVVVYVKKGGDVSLLTLSKKLKKSYRQIKADTPPGVNTSIIYNASITLFDAITQLIIAGVLAICIASIVLYVFLRNGTATFTISLSIPISILLTFFVIKVLGIKIDVMTLTGLAVGIGMMVDNSIVVLESIYFNVKKWTVEEVTDSTHRVSMAITASTATTIAVFIPTIFLSPKIRILFGNLSLALIITLLSSLLIAIICIPVLLRMFHTRIKLIHTTKPTKKPSSISIRIKEILFRSIVKPSRSIISSLIIVFLGMFSFNFIGQDIFTSIESNTFHVYIELPSGTNLDKTSKISKEVDKILLKRNEIKKTDARIEKGHTVLTVTVKPDYANDINDIILRMRSLFKKYRKAFVHVSADSAGGQGSTKKITISVLGDNLVKLKKWAKKGASVIGQLPFISQVVLNFKENVPEIHIHVKHEMASLFGMTSRDLGFEIRSSIYGPIATKYIEKNREVDVRVRLSDGDKYPHQKLPWLPINVGQNKVIPLSSVADIIYTNGSGKFFRQNGRLAASFTAHYIDKDLGSVLQQINRQLKQLNTPSGITFYTGEIEKELKSTGAAGLFSVLIASALIFMILASLYESYSLPVIIFSIIPIALSTTLIFLAVSGISLSVSVYLGIVLLLGLVVNNGIIIVDNAKHLLGKHKTNLTPTVLQEKIYQALEQRLKPLFMTSTTTILGLIPMLISTGHGSALYRVLAATVLVGLVITTVVTLFMIPNLLYLYYRKK